jgi:hypothetical protein
MFIINCIVLYCIVLYWVHLLVHALIIQLCLQNVTTVPNPEGCEQELTSCLYYLFGPVLHFATF